MYTSGGYRGTSRSSSSTSSTRSTQGDNLHPLLQNPSASNSQSTIRRSNSEQVIRELAEERAREEARSDELRLEEARLELRYKMNFQNYMDSPGAGPSSNPRQAPPSPAQGMNHNNGMNGGMPLGGMVGYPTPAGHQSDLNYLKSMVEELSSVLRNNQLLTANIVDKMGKVKEKAKDLNLSNNELIAVVASELNGKLQTSSTCKL